MDTHLLPGLDANGESDRRMGRGPGGQPRLRRDERAQVKMMMSSLDDLLPQDHRTRLVWRVVERLDVTHFQTRLSARGDAPGRAATDPRILITLWLYAAIDGVGSGREIDRLCKHHDAYRWLAGGVSLNGHTINDFRVTHEQALDAWFAQVIALPVKEALVDVQRIAQDGMRVRASAGSNTFRSESSLKRLKSEAAAHVAQLKYQNDPALSAQQRARQRADAQAREARVTEALAQLLALHEAQAKQAKRSGRKPRVTRVSTTDPDARVMKMPDGGFRPAYNVQLAGTPRAARSSPWTWSTPALTRASTRRCARRPNNTPANACANTCSTAATSNSTQSTPPNAPA